MSLKFKKNMTEQDMIDILNEKCCYNDSNFDIIVIENLYKNYDEYPLSESGSWRMSVICSYNDFCKLYYDTGGVVNGQLETT